MKKREIIMASIAEMLMEADDSMLEFIFYLLLQYPGRGRK